MNTRTTPTTTEFFRIEDEDNIGPYRSQLNPFEYNKSFGFDPKIHPCPMLDTRLFRSLFAINLIDMDGTLVDRSYKFGFSSIIQMRAWWHNDDVLKHLHNLGFCVKVYSPDGDDVVHGSAQAMAILDDVSFTQHSIVEFFGLC